MDALAIIEGLRTALNSYAAIAAACGQWPQQVTKWKKAGVPARHCQAIEAACAEAGHAEWTCERIRPDLEWARDTNGTAFWRERTAAA